MELNDIFPIRYSFLIPLAPLIGAVIAGFFCTGPRKKLAHWPIWLGVGFAALLSFCLIAQMFQHAHGEEPVFAIKNYFTWIEAGNFKVNWGYLFDPLTAVMLCVVCGIGFLITVFAAGYMKGEEGYFRFFAYLGLFIFMMTNLVMGENLVMLYLGWEGVGLCSYLLIGYYYEKPAAREAAKKAFLVNRVGDFGFALGIMLSFMAFGTISYFSGTTAHNGLLEQAAQLTAAGGNVLTPFQQQALKWIPFLLMVGAFGKSAQFPLYVWLPDAMEGPTPVSALIHAATMVTAGVYMIARCGTLFVGNQAAMWTIAVVGAFTAIFAATIALRQFDLKKVFAYSTVSQLGFMFVGVGVLAPVAGVFHLVTHAFFKALLFLSSGVVMHAMAGELDMRKMSGLKTVLPKTRILMLIGCCALAGLPFFSGFFSKDEIVANAWEHSKVIGLVMLVTAFMTAYYTFRLYFRVFEGPTIIPPPPADAHGGHGSHHDAEADHSDQHHHHNHEPALMILPLVILAIGALAAGYINWPGERLGEFLGKSPSLKYAYDVATRAPAHVAEHLVVNPIPFGQMKEALEVFDKEQLEVIHHQHLLMMFISAGIAVAGVLLAYVMHLKDRAAADRAADRFRGAVRLLDHKYWIDEIYQGFIVEPLRSLGVAFFTIDKWIVDGFVNLVGIVPTFFGYVVKFTTQRGYLQGYAAAMLFGIAVILIVMFWEVMGILLLLILLLPLLGAVVCALLPSGKAAKTWALLISLATAACAIALVPSFDFKRDSKAPSVQVEFPSSDAAGSNPFRIEDINFQFHLGVDTISLWLILLTVLLMPPALLASFESIKDRQKEYYSWMLVLLAAMNGVFLARDLLLFYVFFELTLIPMFFIIGIWGGPERRYAALKFFLFTFAGGIFTLAGVIYVGYRAQSFDIGDVVRFAQTQFTSNERYLLLLAFLAGFAVKVPLFPVHTWLPLAHTEAPTAGSVILAGVLLKLGTYGLLRLAWPIGLVGATGAWVGPMIWTLGVLCVIGIIYGALVAWVQQDIKKLVAYSSVSHLGFCVLGLVALNDIGMQGSVLYMINHGLSTGAMFLVIGMIYDRLHTRDINELSGLARVMPRMAFFFVFFMLSSIGLPGLNGFVSEFLTVLGAFTSKHLGIAFGVFAAIGVILGALYMLHMTARVIFGPLKYPGAGDSHGHEHGHAQHAPPTDIGGREIGLLIPIALAVILLGVLPTSVLTSILGPIEQIQTPAVLSPSRQRRAEAPTQAPAAEPQGAAERVSLLDADPS